MCFQRVEMTLAGIVKFRDIQMMKGHLFTSRVIVGFGHASPLMEGRKDALGQACEQAGLKADQQIVMFSKENVPFLLIEKEKKLIKT